MGPGSCVCRGYFRASTANWVARINQNIRSRDQPFVNRGANFHIFTLRVKTEKIYYYEISLILSLLHLVATPKQTSTNSCLTQLSFPTTFVFCLSLKSTHLSYFSVFFHLFPASFSPLFKKDSANSYQLPNLFLKQDYT